jgi:hypothetical protein
VIWDTWKYWSTHPISRHFKRKSRKTNQPRIVYKLRKQISITLFTTSKFNFLLIKYHFYVYRQSLVNFSYLNINRKLGSIFLINKGENKIIFSRFLWGPSINCVFWILHGFSHLPVSMKFLFERKKKIHDFWTTPKMKIYDIEILYSRNKTDCKEAIWSHFPGKSVELGSNFFLSYYFIYNSNDNKKNQLTNKLFKSPLNFI